MSKQPDRRSFRTHPGNSDHPARMKNLKQQLRNPDNPFIWADEDLDPEIEREFLESILHFEEASRTTHAKQLLADGVALPAPDAMTDEELHGCLWEVIRALADRHTFLYSTDHLNDRALYTLLWEEMLNEETFAADDDNACHCIIDVLGSGSEEDVTTWLRYYADEEDRRHWATLFPEMTIPPRKALPYARDRHLPQTTEL